MTNRRFCAFTCCNAEYLPQAIVALTSARKWMPALDLLMVSDSLASPAREDLKRYGIEAVIDPLDGHFTQSWEYPRQCYFIFAAPMLLHARGYDAGLYFDADVLVNGDLLQAIAETRTIAGVEVGPLKSVMKGNVPEIENEFGPLRDIKRIQSGVLAMNFLPLIEGRLLEKSSQLYKRCIEIGAPRKGDDSLLALTQHAHPEIEFSTLNSAFNIIEYDSVETGSEEWHRRGEATLAADAIFHFAAKSKKPWLNPDSYPSFRAKYFSNKWQRHAVDTLLPRDLKQWFPRLHKSLRADHLKFYWYPAKNVGDQITPYFLSKSGSRTAVGISEKKIKKAEEKLARFRKIRNLVRLFNSSMMTKSAKYVTSCGSIVRLCGDHALVFGSGIRSREQEVAQPFIRFVRGPLTRERFLSEGVECPAVFGDPALVLPRVFNPRVEKTHDLGIIPHFTEVEAVLESWALKEGEIILDARTNDVEAFVSQLVACRRSISSSLHGLIFSHAYRVPTRHVILTDTIFGDGTKFQDHYATMGLRHDPIDLRDGRHTGMDLSSLADEIIDFDDRFLWDECFFDHSGLKRSLGLPY